MINVTKSYLPPLEEYTKYLEKIWTMNHLTNHGPLVCELEEKLKEYLGVKHLFFVANGTIALQIALKALDLKGEIITTPFSYVATTSSIVWEGSTPVFADIDKDNLCLDVTKLEDKINSQTVGLLPVHVYGNCCNVEEIDRIAKKHNLRVIYDAAHTFGVKYGENKSVLNYGDISTLSFHATKIFHTIEGGAVITNNDEIAHKISYLRNFGHNGPEAFFGLGINGKNCEFHAAMGLCILPKIDEFIEKRKNISLKYDSQLKEYIKRPILNKNIRRYNYSYYPILFKSENDLLRVKEMLIKNEINPRRYFFPSLNTLDYTKEQKCPISESTAKRVLCLPLYPELREKEIDLITSTIIKGLSE